MMVVSKMETATENKLVIAKKAITTYVIPRADKKLTQQSVQAYANDICRE